MNFLYFFLFQISEFRMTWFGNLFLHLVSARYSWWFWVLSLELLLSIDHRTPFASFIYVGINGEVLLPLCSCTEIWYWAISLLKCLHCINLRGIYWLLRCPFCINTPEIFEIFLLAFFRLPNRFSLFSSALHGRQILKQREPFLHLLLCSNIFINLLATWAYV